MHILKDKENTILRNGTEFLLRFFFTLKQRSEKMKKHKVEYKGEKYELSDKQYEELKSAIELIEKANMAKFSDINSDDLVDIKNVNIDQDLSKLENVVKYINEVKNPYYFKVGKVKVRVLYADTDRTLDDSFAHLLKIKFIK